MKKWTLIYIDHEFNEKNSFDYLPQAFKQLGDHYYLYYIDFGYDKLTLYAPSKSYNNASDQDTELISYKKTLLTEFKQNITLTSERVIPYNKYIRYVFGYDWYRSQSIANALKSLFHTIVKEGTSEHYAIKTKGHGSNDGLIFQDQLKSNDAQQLFEYIVQLIGKPIDIFDLSSNCQMAKF